MQVRDHVWLSHLAMISGRSEKREIVGKWEGQTIIRSAKSRRNSTIFLGILQWRKAYGRQQQLYVNNDYGYVQFQRKI